MIVCYDDPNAALWFLHGISLTCLILSVKLISIYSRIIAFRPASSVLPVLKLSYMIIIPSDTPNYVQWSMNSSTGIDTVNNREVGCRGAILIEVANK